MSGPASAGASSAQQQLLTQMQTQQRLDVAALIAPAPAGAFDAPAEPKYHVKPSPGYGPRNPVMTIPEHTHLPAPPGMEMYANHVHYGTPMMGTSAGMSSVLTEHDYLSGLEGGLFRHAMWAETNTTGRMVLSRTRSQALKLVLAAPEGATLFNKSGMRQTRLTDEVLHVTNTLISEHSGLSVSVHDASHQFVHSLASTSALHSSVGTNASVSCGRAADADRKDTKVIG